MPLIPAHIAGRRLLALLVTISVASGLAACQREQAHTEVVVVVASATKNEPAAVLAPPDLADSRQTALSVSGAGALIVGSNTGQPATVALALGLSCHSGVARFTEVVNALH